MARMFLALFFLLVNTSMFAIESFETMQESIDHLESGASFAFVNLSFSDEELELFQQIKTNQTAEIRRFGDIHLLYEELPEFLREIGNEDEDLILRVTEIVVQITKDVVDAFDADTAYLAIRSFKKSNLFDKPRWHVDNYKQFDVMYKFATVLKGPQTLFYDLPENLREKFLKDVKKRDKLINKKKVITAENGFGSIFIISGLKVAAVHSEPPISEDRFFFYVVPGSHESINKIKKHPPKWNRVQADFPYE